MAVSQEDIKKRYPLPVYNFKVTLGAVEVSFSEVSGLLMEYETVSYRHGLSFLEGETVIRFLNKKAIPITMKKGVVKDVAELYEWFTDARRKNILVSLCDEEGHPLLVWKIASALPVKLNAPTFDANANEVAIDSLEIMAGDISLEII